MATVIHLWYTIIEYMIDWLVTTNGGVDIHMLNCSAVSIIITCTLVAGNKYQIELYKSIPVSLTAISIRQFHYSMS